MHPTLSRRHLLATALGSLAAGHGIGSTRAQQDSEALDTYAFLLWQTRGQA